MLKGVPQLECPMIQDATSTCIKQKGNNGDEIKRKGCSIIAPTPTNNASWPPRYTHPRITWFRPSLCCNGTSLQAGSRLPNLIRCTTSTPPCRWQRCSRRCVKLRISKVEMWHDMTLAWLYLSKVRFADAGTCTHTGLLN